MSAIEQSGLQQSNFSYLLKHGLIVDNFAGGGGASTGIEMFFGRGADIAINHDPQAISMHMANHPNTKHYCESVWDINPVKVTKGRPVLFGWFSPDCKHHSRCKGGKPLDKNIRGLAWVTVRWGLFTDMHYMALENVPEFKHWGPLGHDDKPRKDLAGQTFDGFMLALTTGLTPKHPAWREAVRAMGIQYNLKMKLKLSKGLGYSVEYQDLAACDHSAPTSRNRFFLFARKDGMPVNFPKPEFGAPLSLEVQAGKLKPWVPASNCIDFSIPCKSIFNRKKALAEKTLIRLGRGVRRYVIDNPTPYVQVVDSDEVPKGNESLVMTFLTRHYRDSCSSVKVDPKNALNSITMSDARALAMSHLIKFRGQEYGQDISRPIPTITAGGLHIGEVRTFFKKYLGSTPCNDELPIGVIRYQDELYQVVDICMRMLGPRELFNAQGFPDDYIIDRTHDGEQLTQKAQIKMCGNSVSPVVAKALLRANLGSLMPLRIPA